MELPTEPTNDIEMEVLVWPTRAQLEQVVELSILLKGERYSDALRDTASFQYQTLNQQFIDKVRLRNVCFPLYLSPSPYLIHSFLLHILSSQHDIIGNPYPGL